MRPMERFCEKYQEKMDECTHLEEYCRYRTACVINFLTRERQRNSRRSAETGPTGNDAGGFGPGK